MISNFCFKAQKFLAARPAGNPKPAGKFAGSPEVCHHPQSCMSPATLVRLPGEATLWPGTCAADGGAACRPAAEKETSLVRSLCSSGC
jgi:hypothetical protein